MTAIRTIATLLLLAVPHCACFSPIHSAWRGSSTTTLTTPSSIAPALQLRASPPLLIDGAISTTLDPSSMIVSTMTTSFSPLSFSSIVLSETEAWVVPLSLVLGPFLNFFSFAMLCRIVLSWYPSTNVNEVPFNIVVWPTEPLLRLLRGSVPPAFGVDITPVVWLGLFSFMNEIFLGQQGLLTMKMRYGI
ncbi:hypothetical protein ACHAXA_003898 [Cyclostephanos tholiformis]|uniref:Uncharacterized protein n=1 Tax=Cyclostephanos tholiformis TaxID=382380 RepID=A0ABD3R7V7_9STRA